MRYKTSPLLVTLILVAEASGAASFSIIDAPPGADSWLRASAWVGFSANRAPELDPTIPFADGHSATLGGSSTQATYSFSATALEVSFSQTLGLDLAPFTVIEGSIRFQVDAPVDYVLEGLFTGSDADNIRLFQSGTVQDLTSFTFLFRQEQDTRGVTEAALELGVEGGNFSNFLEGSTTGSLVPGHVYSFRYKAVLDDQEASSSSSSIGSGNFRLALVPEPSPGLLVCGGLVAIAGARRRLTRWDEKGPSPCSARIRFRI